MAVSLSRRQLVGGALASGLIIRTAHAAPPSTMFREVMLVDGTGAPGRLANVHVSGGTITAITAPSARATAAGARIVAGEGRILAPGFIDLHVHGDPLVDRYDGFLAMGVTTVCVGPDGSGPRVSGDLDLRSWMAAVDQAQLDCNVVTFASHGTLRHAAGISDAVRQPDAAALARLTAQLDAELGAGAYGLTYGLEYVPGIYTETPELTALGRVVAKHDGVVMSHMRSENDDEIEAAIDELIASAGPARPHISHLKVVFGKGGERARQLLEFLAAKRASGIDLSADMYPYNASFTGVSILFPEWALPPTDYSQILATRRDELRDYLEKRMIRRGGPEKLLFGRGKHTGKTVAQAAAEAGLAFPDFLVQLGPNGGSGAHFTMDQALQNVLLVDPTIAIASDGGPSMRHPRSTGTFAKWIEEYAAKGSNVTLAEAVRKCTTLPAHILRMPGRGRIQVGAAADLLLFNPEAVQAKSTFTEPLTHAKGFDMVMIGGTAAYEQGTATARSGRLLRAKRP